MRPSEPLLDWIRNHIRDKGLNTAAVAELAELPRGRCRKILAGIEPMELDEFLVLSRALALTPADFGLDLELGEEEPEEEPIPDLRVAGRRERQPLVVNPWGNQVEQVFRFAFDLGCDFLFVARSSELADSGLPAKTLASWAGRDIPVKMDAIVHQYNDPLYEPGFITLNLSFDAVYRCRFPWSSIRAITLFPVVPEPEEAEVDEEEGDGDAPPFLRLV